MTRFDRRIFLQAAAAACACAGAIAATTQPHFRMGLQMYTVREPMAKDAAGTLKQIGSAASSVRMRWIRGTSPGRGLIPSRATSIPSGWSRSV